MPTAEQVVTKKLFTSFHGGFGDSDLVNGEDGRYNRVHGAMDPRWPRQLRPGFRVSKLASPNHDLTPVFAIEWTDTNGVYPAVFYIVGKKMQKIRFGAVTEVSTNMNSLAATNATGGMFDDDGSGVPYIYACFGGISTDTKIVRMNRAQTFTQSADVVADKLLSLNGKAYRTIRPSSGTIECQVSTCGVGANRFTAATWGAGVTVGYAGTKINALVAVRQAPVAIKPEGIFAYNQARDQWINYTPSWRQFMHLDNGVGAYFLGDALVVPMGDGGAVIFDGNNVKPFDPGLLMATPNVHTTKSNFTAVSSMRHWLVGATRTSSKRIRAGGTQRWMYKVAAGTFTDDSADLRDADLTTGHTFTYAVGDEIYIGWDYPFTTVRFDSDSANTTARTMTVKVGTAASTFTTVGVKNTGFRDFTELAGAPLGQSGEIALMVDPVTLGWVKNTVNSIEAYWMQITFSGTTTSTSWLECNISPWYPSVDATDFPLDGIDKSGNFPHLLFGRFSPETGNRIWHDLFTLPEPDAIGVIIFADGGKAPMNHSRNLFAIGRFNIWQIDFPDDDRPGTEPHPFVNNIGLIEGPSFVVEDGKLAEFRGIRVNGHEHDPAMPFRFYYSWDNKKWSRLAKELHFPDEYKLTTGKSRGYRFRWAVGFYRSASTSPLLSQPVITDIEADFVVVEGVDVFGSQQDRAVRALPVF